MTDPDRERRIAEYRAQTAAAHDAWCREQAAKHRAEAKQVAIADQARAVTEASHRSTP